MSLSAGQCWHFNAPDGFEDARIVIGAIASFSDDARVICCSVSNAPERQSDGHLRPVTIPFIAMTEAAFTASITTLDETNDAGPADGFAEALDEWRGDPKGLSCFTVPFEGFLDRMIARQMAAIVGTDAA